MSDSAEETPAAETEKPKKKGAAPLLLGVVNLAATGFLVFKTMTAAHATAAPAEPPPPPPGEVAAVEGPVVTVDPFVVNLRDEGVSRYLKAGFELELANAKAVTELEKAKRVVRDELLRYLSGLTVAETLGEEGKQRIGDAILERLTRVLGPDRVKRLFFVDFVIQ